MQNSIWRFMAGTALSLVTLASQAGTVYKTVSLEASGVLQEAAGPAARCPTRFGGSITGFGDSALIGRHAFVATDCIKASYPIFESSRGQLILLTTAGDQIFVTYSGQMVPTGDGAKYVFTGGTFQIVGGTGLYKNASGGGTLDGAEDMATGQGTMKMTGRISYFAPR
ncbi:MAG TPA: hypothetical protein VGF27_11405 [Pseudoduganella sp.]